jgi:Dyp-type peroxidase family
MTATLDLDDIQGLLVRGYSRLKAASFLLLQIADPAAARRWVAAVAGRITPGGASPNDLATHLAFTYAGLECLGLRQEGLAGFPPEYARGMTTAHDSRMLGDLGESSPACWRWGAPTTPPVHLVLLLYGRDAATLGAAVERHQDELARSGLVELVRLETTPLGLQENFGFHDGISQPLIDGLPRAVSTLDTVAAGEFILGYQNQYGRYTERPLLPAAADAELLLPRDPEGSGNADLGRNGTYLVLRQLRQDVPGFWQFLDRVTRQADGGGDQAARIRLAAKMVGRWPGGAPLVMAPDEDVRDLADANDFRYAAADPDGRRCPHGAHIRRANPRDSLDPSPGSQRSIDVGKRHRILRRGRVYGPPLDQTAALATDSPDGDEERGLHFICLNANIARQFEFIQHTWINNPKFNGLYDDPDPVTTAAREFGGTFTIQASPLRQRVTGLPSFVTVLGGAYFFLPGIRAIRYLASAEEVSR